jgi:hypothetical protein
VDEDRFRPAEPPLTFKAFAARSEVYERLEAAARIIVEKFLPDLLRSLDRSGCHSLLQFGEHVVDRTPGRLGDALGECGAGDTQGADNPLHVLIGRQLRDELVRGAVVCCHRLEKRDDLPPPFEPGIPFYVVHCLIVARSQQRPMSSRFCGSL